MPRDVCHWEGVIDDHYRALDKERAELEAMEEQKKIEYRMQNRAKSVESYPYFSWPPRYSPDKQTDTPERRSLTMKSGIVHDRGLGRLNSGKKNHAYRRGFLF